MILIDKCVNLKLIWKKNYDTKAKKEKSLIEFGGGGLGVLVFFFFLFSFSPMVAGFKHNLFFFPLGGGESRERERF